MPAKSKKDKRKKKKGRLTNEDILKLIKKLKPKNQQTVRINIGDKDDKKKAVSSNQPQVRSEVSYFRAPPQTDFFQPPQPPMLINKPPPSLAETKAQFEAPTKQEIKEFEPKFIPAKRRPKKRIELQPEEYTYEEPSPVKASFQLPQKFRQSILGAAAVVPTRYYEPVENDRFQPELIQTNQSQDQIGNRSSFNMSSDTWTLAPDGDVQSVEEMQEAKKQQPLATEPEQTEEELIKEQSDLLAQNEEEAEGLISSAEKESTRQSSFKKAFNPYESSSESDVLMTSLASNMSINDVNRLIREDQINMDEFGLSSKAVYQTGQKKGQLRKEITSRELYPILQAIDKRGLELKKTVPKLTPLQKESQASV